MRLTANTVLLSLFLIDLVRDPWRHISYLITAQTGYSYSNFAVVAVCFVLEARDIGTRKAQLTANPISLLFHLSHERSQALNKLLHQSCS